METRLPLILAALTVFSISNAFALADDKIVEPEATPAGKVVWTDVTTGFKQAKENNKLILADIYTDDCGPCKKLDKLTFKDPEIERYLAADFVCIKVDARDKGVGQQFTQKHKVERWPTVLVFNSAGKLKGTIRGFLKPADFGTKLKSIAAKH